MAVVTMIVRARIASPGRDIVEASSDLYATPLGTLRQVVLPQIMPSVLAGFLLAFTDEIAEGILFLVSDRSSNMTGQALVLDGGETIV